MTGTAPDPAELLALARETVLGELLPALPEEKRYAARLVANAIAIAARQIGARTPLSADERRALASAIRAGRHDGDAALHARLLADVHARLAVSNPKALPREESPQRHGEDGE
jgi:hypothetical protein